MPVTLPALAQLDSVASPADLDAFRNDRGERTEPGSTAHRSLRLAADDPLDEYPAGPPALSRAVHPPEIVVVFAGQARRRVVSGRNVLEVLAEGRSPQAGHRRLRYRDLLRARTVKVEYVPPALSVPLDTPSLGLYAVPALDAGSRELVGADGRSGALATAHRVARADFRDSLVLVALPTPNRHFLAFRRLAGSSLRPHSPSLLHAPTARLLRPRNFPRIFAHLTQTAHPLRFPLASLDVAIPQGSERSTRTHRLPVEPERMPGKRVDERE